ncbi:MAG TPA: PspC domain-containing protein, partial [Alphaproteobacteria bacterium]|nr:PspC domain-containing protein [Alphaproteobacteria bacterium]
MNGWRPYRDPVDGSPDPTRLYRNPDRGMILGVCAGLADYFGMKDWHIRGLAILFLCVFPPQ